MPSNPSIYRGIIHFHSSYSPDSLTTIGQILSAAQRESLDFLILTDHDDDDRFAGACPTNRRAWPAAASAAGR